MDNEDLMIAVKNMCWMAEKIHQAHHDTVPATWKLCGKGVCGSMEYMLAQVGLTKDLTPRDKVP
jgi:hypothetical protein